LASTAYKLALPLDSALFIHVMLCGKFEEEKKYNRKAYLEHV
jgi:hypothetical protein